MTVDLCRHIKTNGKVCNSPALTRSAFCYFHAKLRRRHRTLVHTAQPAIQTYEIAYDTHGYPIPQPLPEPASNAATAELDLPLLEDAESVQVALSIIVSAIAHNRIDSRRAAAILYGLQLASANARHTVTQPVASSIAPDSTRGRSGFDLLPKHLCLQADPSPNTTR